MRTLRRISGGRVLGTALATVVLATMAASAGETSAGKAAGLNCAADATVAGGAPDPSLLAREASKGIRAIWCERYDALGRATRLGPYREFYPNGGLRVRGQYVDSQLAGPIVLLHEDGTVFMRGFLDEGEWTGAFEIFHESGAVWFEAEFEAGKLQGPLRTRYRDGALESETQYQRGREDGLARSFFPTAAGGRLKSEAQVEANRIVGRHRLLDRNGELVRSIDRSAGPPSWRRPVSEPAVAGFLVDGDAPSQTNRAPATATDPSRHRAAGPAAPAANPSTTDEKSPVRD